MYNAEQDVQNFPDNAARWTGEKVQDVENIPGDVEGAWDRTENRIDNDINQDIQNVEDFPEDAARWTGEKVQDVENIPGDIEGAVGGAFQDVENFGDRMDNAYDQGQAEGENDSW